MKSQILKIAGVKSEKEFYKKYPTEAAFFKAHPEAKSIKKAQSGLQTDSNNNGIPDYLEINPTLGQNQFMNGNYSIGSFYQNPPAQYPGTMFKSTQMPEEDYGKPSGLSRPPQNWETPSSIPEGLSQGPSYTMNDYMQKNNQSITGQDGSGTGDTSKGGGQGFNTQGFGNVFSGAVEGFNQINEEKALRRKLNTWANVSDIVKSAGISNAFAEKPKRQWFRPDDKRFIHNASELSNIQGRGTDILATQNGGGIGGNPTEIQNTYAPEHTLFDDLGYEPLQNDQQIKAFASGGGFGSMWGQANAGLSGNGNTSFMSNVGQGSPFDSTVGGMFGNSGGYKAGSSIGSLFGPVGSLVGGMFGGMLDKEPGEAAFQQGRINENNNFLSSLDVTNGITGGLNSMRVGKNGGYVSNDWQPQVIATFGEHKVKDLLKPPHDADMLRAGGHLREYTAPSARAMETYENGGEISSYAMGGQLKTHWGGEARPIAQNPYLPGSGEIVMLDGASHNNDGIGISYAQNGMNVDAQIEAEGGEPIVELPSNDQSSTEAVVFGNIPFSKKVAEATGDEALINIAKKYDGKTFKRIVADMAKTQNKANKTKIKATELADKADANTKGGALDLKTAEMMLNGADDTLKEYADNTIKLSNLQNAIQDVKKDVSYMRGKNISAENLGKGKIIDDYDPITKDAEIENPYAKSGAYLRKAQNSTVVTPDEGSITEDQYNNFIKLYNESQATKGKKNKSTLGFQKLYHQSFPEEALAAIQKTTRENGLSNKAKEMGLTVEDILSGKDVARILKSNEDEYHGPRTDQYMASVRSHFKKAPDLKLNALGNANTTTATNTTKTPIGVVPYQRNKLIDYANMLYPLFRNDELPPLDPRQLAGEYMSIAQNQYEPVPSQQYAVELDPVYRVSYQDVRNQNTADFRDAERNLGYNPAALAGLLGKKYLGNQAVNAEEFRTNQAIENQIYGGNRAKVNQERMANIQLNADQMNKQELAKSRTKETQQTAIASIADKYLQHDARNLEYNVYKNMFPQYGFDSSGRIHNQGPWYQPTIPQIYGGKSTIEEVPVYGPDGKIQYYKMQQKSNTTTETTTAPYQTPGIVANKKNGGSVSKKNNKNSSIVKAYKNL